MYDLRILNMKKHIFFLFIFFTSIVFAQEQSPLIEDKNVIYRSLHEALANPEIVYRLNLSRTKLKKFPVDIFKLKNLRMLDLSRNKLDSLPKEIGSLTNLEWLNLSSNYLVQLPDEIGRLTSLTYLGLNRNEIEEVPSSIGDLEKLEILELWDNELSTLPDAIVKCKNLKVVELRGILFSNEVHARLDTLLPDAKVYMSPPCYCTY